MLPTHSCCVCAESCGDAAVVDWQPAAFGAAYQPNGGYQFILSVPFEVKAYAVGVSAVHAPSILHHSCQK